MRVGIDARMWRHTGIGRYLQNLIPAFARMNDLTVVAWVATADLADAHQAFPGVVVRACDAPLFSAREQLFWRAELPKLGLEVFHAPYVNAPLSPGVPLVLTVHDLIPLHFPGTHKSKLGTAYYRGMMALGPRRAARILTHAQVTQADMQRLLGVPAEKVSVIPLAADLRFAEAQAAERRAAVRARYGLGGVPYVLYTGQWKRYKNLDTLIAGFARLKHPTAKLVLAGKVDAASPQVPAAIAHHHLQDRVVCTDWIADDADLVALYQEAAAFAFPSRYEGFGLPPLEAMAAGVPVASSHAGALAEAVGDGALLVSPDDPQAWADALDRLLTDDTLRAGLIARGQARVRALSWAATATATAAAYRQAARGSMSE